MWSHTIQSSRANAQVPPKPNPLRAKAVASNRSSIDATGEEGMNQGLEVDSVDSSSANLRAHVSKKPLTVGKAPALSRTTSRADRTPTTPKEGTRPVLDKRASRVTPASSAKTGTPTRGKVGTPTQQPSVTSRARPPPLSARSNPKPDIRKITRAGTPVHEHATVKGSKSTTTKKPGDIPVAPALLTPSTPVESEIPKEDRPATHSPVSAGSRRESFIDDGGSGGANEDAALEDNERSNGPSDKSTREGAVVGEGEHYQNNEEHTGIDSHEELNREITLRNITIKSLREELQSSQVTHDRKVEELQSAASAHDHALRSELDSVRATLVDLDDTRRTSLEKHDSLLRSRDKIIQNLSSEVSDFREKWETAEETKKQTVQGLEKKVQALSQLENASDHGDHHDLLLRRDEEIRSMSENIQDLQKQLEAADTARAKEIYDELLRSKDQEIEKVSNVADGLRGELTGSAKVGTDRSQKHDALLRAKNDEIKSLSKTIQSLRDKLEATDKAQEQEVNHSVSSLRDEFQDLQNKHKRKIEELEVAASARANALQSEYDELLRSKDQEIKDKAGLAQGLQDEIETVRANQRRELEDADARFEQGLQDVKAQFDKALQTRITEHQEQLEAENTSHKMRHAEHQSELNELHERHRCELDAIGEEHQRAVRTQQQELQETKRKHDQSIDALEKEGEIELQVARDSHAHIVETLKTEHEHKLRDTIDDHQQKHTEASDTHERALESLELKLRKEQESTSDLERVLNGERAKHHANIQDAAQKHEQGLRDAVHKHKQDPEEASKDYQRQLADVEKLRGDSDKAISQKHETQLHAIAEKYQQELAEASQKLDDMASHHENKLEDVKRSLHEAVAQAEDLRAELEQRKKQCEITEIENRAREKEIQDTTTSHGKQIEELGSKHGQELEEASTKYNQLQASSDDQAQKNQRRLASLEADLENLRAQIAAEAAEAVSLRNIMQDRESLKSKHDEDVRLQHQLALDGLALKHTKEVKELDAQLQDSANEMVSLKSTITELEAFKDKAIEERALMHEQVLKEAFAGHEKELEALERERDLLVQELSVQRNKVHSLESSESESAKRINALEQAVHDAELVRKEGMVDLALLKDKLELKDRDIERNEEKLLALQGEIKQLQNDLGESTDELTRERNEAAVEIALLKDRLELAELHRQSAAEDASLSQNEANVEIALLKDKLELAELQTRGDKEAVTALEARLNELHAKAPENKPFVHYQLREEMGMLARHHAANLADVAALKDSILKEREIREEEWRRKTEERETIAKQLYGMGAELNGIASAH